jgi:hypothetical protein
MTQNVCLITKFYVTTSCDVNQSQLVCTLTFLYIINMHIISKFCTLTSCYVNYL